MKKNLKVIAIAEGCSMLAFAITMPLKYGLDISWPNKIVGWLHGLLFILYVVGMIWAGYKYQWSLRNIFIALIASIIPLLPFYVEKKIIR